MHRDPSFGEVIEGRNLARGQGRGDEARPVCDQEAPPAGVLGGVWATRNPSADEAV